MGKTEKKKVLIISARIPNCDGMKRDQKSYNFIKVLSNEYDVTYLYSQSMFLNEDSMKKIKDMGVSFVSLKEIEKVRSIDNKMETIFKNNKFDFVVFQNQIDAKYYLPYINIYASKSIVVMSVIGQGYHLSKAASEYNENDFKWLFDVDIDIVDSTAIFNFVDLVITDEEAVSVLINEITANVNISKVSDLMDAEEKTTKEIVNLINNTKKKVVDIETKVDILNVKIAKGADSSEKFKALQESGLSSKYNIIDVEYNNQTIKSINEKIANSDKEYIFIMSNNYFLTAYAMSNVLFAIQSSPKFALVAANSERFSANIVLDEVVQKHFREGFARWSMLREIKDLCVLIRKEAFLKIGEFDDKFKTLNYMLTDYAWKAILNGYLSVNAADSLVVRSEEKIFDEKDSKDDYKYLQKKWNEENPDFIKSVEKKNKQNSNS